VLLLRRLSALDCQAAPLSPPGLGARYPAPLTSAPMAMCRRVPTGQGAATLSPSPSPSPSSSSSSSPSPRGGPGSGHPRPRWAPEPHLRRDLGAGVPPAVTIWPISGRTSPPPLHPGRLLAVSRDGTGSPGGSRRCRLHARTPGRRGWGARGQHPGDRVANHPGHGTESGGRARVQPRSGLSPQGRWQPVTGAAGAPSNAGPMGTPP